MSHKKSISPVFLFLIRRLHVGKLQALVSTTRDHRREYKAKFVDLDVDFQRMKERLEMLSMILDDMHVKQKRNLTLACTECTRISFGRIN